MNTIKVTKQDIVDFIRKQPDDRKVSMNQTKYDDKCGCVMVQYGKEVIKKPFTHVGWASWWTDDCEEIAKLLNKYGVGGLACNDLDVLTDDLRDELFACKTYGELKKIVG